MVSSEYITMYFVSLAIVSVIGIGIVEWCDKRFEKFISPLYGKVLSRRQYVLEKRKQKQGNKK